MAFTPRPRPIQQHSEYVRHCLPAHLTVLGTVGTHPDYPAKPGWAEGAFIIASYSNDEMDPFDVYPLNAEVLHLYYKEENCLPCHNPNEPLS